MPRQKPILWATSRLEPFDIYIYKKPLRGLYGVTRTRSKFRFDIHLDPRVFDNSGLLWGTVFHEFIHVIELSYTKADWQAKFANRNHCAPYIEAIGKGLSEIMHLLQMEAGASSEALPVPESELQPVLPVFGHP